LHIYLELEGYQSVIFNELKTCFESGNWFSACLSVMDHAKLKVQNSDFART
jgi:hypothetical protein